MQLNFVQFVPLNCIHEDTFDHLDALLLGEPRQINKVVPHACAHDSLHMHHTLSTTHLTTPPHH